MTRPHEPREEPFIGSLRERIQQTKADNARQRASSPTPSRDEGPPSEESLRASRASRALARAEEHRHVTGRVWQVALLLAILAFAVWLAWRYGWITGRTAPVPATPVAVHTRPAPATTLAVT